MKHAFTIDLEDWYHGIELPLSDWSNKERRVDIGTNTILDLLNKHNTKATFFTLGWIANEHPDLVKKVVAAGHELACHSHVHHKVYDLNPDSFKEDTRIAKDSLEQLTGQEITGYRAPYFSITAKSIWALEILEELGFSYDCSISPIVTWRYGIAKSPNHIYGFEGLNLIEFPLSDFRFLFKNWGSGGAYFRIFPLNAFMRSLKKYDREERPFIFYAHPWEYDPGHPVVEMERKAKFTHYRNLNKMAGRTDQILKHFQFTTVSEVLKNVNASALTKLSVEELIT